jgi:hypothetical protein
MSPRGAAPDRHPALTPSKLSASSSNRPSRKIFFRRVRYGFESNLSERLKKSASQLNKHMIQLRKVRSL